jgi:hypothetical protein
MLHVAESDVLKNSGADKSSRVAPFYLFSSTSLEIDLRAIAEKWRRLASPSLTLSLSLYFSLSLSLSLSLASVCSPWVHFLPSRPSSLFIEGESERERERGRESFIVYIENTTLGRLQSTQTGTNGSQECQIGIRLEVKDFSRRFSSLRSKLDYSTHRI